MDNLELTIWDQKLNKFRVIDQFKSLVWTQKWQDDGEFQAEVALTEDTYNIVRLNYYVTFNKVSNGVCVIESKSIKRETDGSMSLVVSGRDVTSVLRRRIILGTALFNNSTALGVVNTMILGNIHNNAGDVRRMNQVISYAAYQDGVTTSSPTDFSVTRGNYDWMAFNNLGEQIRKILNSYNIGMRSWMKPEFGSDLIMLTLSRGTDRTKSWTGLPLVTFDVEVENLISYNYTETTKDLYNYRWGSWHVDWNKIPYNDMFHSAYRTLAVRYTSQGVSFNRNNDAGPSGVLRRESHSWYDDINPIEYQKQFGINWTYFKYYGEGGSLDRQFEHYLSSIRAVMKPMVRYDLESQTSPAAMEIKTDPNLYPYPDKDYKLGDTVSVRTPYTSTRKFLVTELTWSLDSSGYSVYPTFQDTSPAEFEKTL